MSTAVPPAPGGFEPGTPARSRGRARLGLVLVVLIGAVIGGGLYTFTYAEGYSYIRDDPRVCANCHIMESAYDSWLKASHHTVAICGDCHLPADPVGKLVGKMINGWNHSVAFTLQNFPEPIRVTERSAEVLQASCLHCHGDITHAIAAGPSGAGDPVRCTHCHSRVGHGDRAGLGGRFRESEIPEEYRG